MTGTTSSLHQIQKMLWSVMNSMWIWVKISQASLWHQPPYWNIVITFVCAFSPLTARPTANELFTRFDTFTLIWMEGNLAGTLFNIATTVGTFHHFLAFKYPDFYFNNLTPTTVMELAVNRVSDLKAWNVTHQKIMTEIECFRQYDSHVIPDSKGN